MGWFKKESVGVISSGKKGVYLTLFCALCLTIGFGAKLSLATSTVSVQVDGQVLTLNSTRNTIGEVLAEAGIALYPGDAVLPGLETAVCFNQSLEIIRAFPVFVVADEHEVAVVTARGTVAEVLEQAGVGLAELDRVTPSLDTRLETPTTIKVVRVSQKEFYQEQEIPISVERIQDTNMEQGIQRIVNAGATGLERQTILVSYEDGQEVNREIVNSEMIREPIKKVVAVGALTSVSRGGQRINFERVMTVRATAYSYSAGSRTATGQRVRVGGIAVDPSVIPYGTRVYVEGYGFATAIDCGGAIKGNRIDVFLESDRECRQWGVKNVKLYILQ